MIHREPNTRTALDLLARQPRLDAIFAASDLLALAALRRSRRRVPRDVALIGFDDTRAPARSEPALTTVRLPFDQLARRGVALLRTPSVPRPPVRWPCGRRARECGWLFSRPLSLTTLKSWGCDVGRR